MRDNRQFPAALEKMFEPFQSFLYEAAGIYFSTTKKGRLLAHVTARMEAVGAKDPKAYLNLLESATGLRGEREAFFNQTTVNETYFFREEQQFAVFRDKILPRLHGVRREEGRDQLVIWSAACSNGAEAYSLAILVLEAMPSEAAHTAIVGFDLNSEAIKQAKLGEYDDYNVRNCTETQRSLFFAQSGKVHRVKSKAKRLTNFQTANITAAADLKRLPRPDLILCRNALIYFDRESKAKVVGAFASVLQPHGYLFLGQTEALFGVEHPFDLVHFFKSTGYRLKR